MGNTQSNPGVSQQQIDLVTQYISQQQEMIKIQQQDVELEKEISAIKFKHSSVGAVSIFIGYVRDINNNKEVTSIDLEV